MQQPASPSGAGSPSTSLPQRLLSPSGSANGGGQREGEQPEVDQIEDEDPPPPDYAKIWERARYSLNTHARNGVLITGDKVTLLDSDGDQSRCPDVEPEEVSDEGRVNYTTLSDPQREASWRRKVAMALSAILGLSVRDKKYTLDRFPSGYVLYVHKKGEKDSPRKDYYLYGSKHRIIFRSPYEFVMHALWLAQNQPVDSEGGRECLCKYCGPVKSQLAISSLWTGKIRRKKPRRRTKKSNRVVVQREHVGIGGAVWVEHQSDSEDE